MLPLNIFELPAISVIYEAINPPVQDSAQVMV